MLNHIQYYGLTCYSLNFICKDYLELMEDDFYSAIEYNFNKLEYDKSRGYQHENELIKFFLKHLSYHCIWIYACHLHLMDYNAYGPDKVVQAMV